MASRFPRPLIPALACLIWACGAGQAPAAAQPRASAPQALNPAPVLAAPRRPPAIGTKNVTRVKKRWEVAAGGSGRAVAMSRALAHVAFSSGSPVQLYDFHTGKAAGTINACPDVIRGGLAYAKGKLVVICESGVRLYEGTKRSKQKVDANSARITAAAFMWPWLALGHHDGVLRIYGLDGSPTREIPVPGPPIDVKSMALTPDGARIAVSWIQGSIWWWDVAQPRTAHKLVRRENESDSVAFNRDGTLFAEEGRTFFTTVWNFSAAPAQRSEVRNGSWVKRILFSRDSKWLFRGGSDGLEIAQIDGPQRVALDTRGAVEDVATDEFGAALAAVDRDGRLTMWTVK